MGLHLGIWPVDETATIIPEAFFLILETLFEAAVRQVLSEIAQTCSVTKGAQLNRPLFDTMRSRYIADPDVVISRAGEVLLVLDTKYKQIDNYPDHGDVILGVTKSQVQVRWAGV